MYNLAKYSVCLVRDSAVRQEGDGVIHSASELAEISRNLRDLDREQLRVYFLNAGSRLIGWELASQGTLTCSLGHPREIFKGAILSNAYAILIVHNHPSGQSEPSVEDIRMTERMRDAGHLLGIEVADHVIVPAGDGPVYSFKEHGKL